MLLLSLLGLSSILFFSGWLMTGQITKGLLLWAQWMGVMGILAVPAALYWLLAR